MAHHIAAWLGIPVGIVIAVMVILRKRGMELRARRQQARAARQASAQAATRASVPPATGRRTSRP